MQGLQVQLIIALDRERPRAAMVAQSEQAILVMAQGNAPEGATSKIPEYMDMSPSSSRASTTSLEQQQTVCVGVKCFGVWLLE